MTEFTPNIPQKILDLLGRNLHNKDHHPIKIIKDHIYNYFNKILPGMFKYDNLEKFVSVKYNFDKILVPLDHPCRSRSDTYYAKSDLVLRTQTSAHQAELLEKNITRFLVTGDVYRKDEIDRTHYPVFHQMEGVYLIDDNEDPIEELKKTLSGLIEYLFPDHEYRYNNDYFPFTNPSFEIEVKMDDKWIEVLGCGVIQSKILETTGHKGKQGWAFGLGLERLAMILFNIPDIRYFWTQDEKFLKQFKNNCLHKFYQYSTLNLIKRDLSFWIPNDQLNETSKSWKYQNDFYDFVRNIGSLYIESLELFDVFFHSKKGQLSHCYHINFKPVDTSITNPAEFKIIVDKLYKQIEEEGETKFNIKIR